MGGQRTRIAMFLLGGWSALCLAMGCRQTSDTHIDEPFKLTMNNRTREEKCLELSGYQWERRREMCLKSDQYSCTGLKKVWRNGRCFEPDSELPKVCPELSFYDGDKCIAQRVANLYTSCLDPSRSESLTVLRFKKKFGVETCQDLWDITRTLTELEFANIGSLDWPTITRLQHLQRLSLINTNLSVVDLSSFKDLRFADFSRNPLTEVVGVSGAGKLVELRLNATKLTNAGLLLNSDSIQTLSIANSGLNSDSFPDALATPNAALLELDLSENDLTEIGFSAQLPSLRFLDLSGNNRLSSIAGLGDILSLRELDIRHTVVRDLSSLSSNADLNLRIDDRTLSGLDPALCPVDAASAQLRELCLSIQPTVEAVPVVQDTGQQTTDQNDGSSPGQGSGGQTGDSSAQEPSDNVESTSDVPQNEPGSSSAEDRDRADG